MRLVGGLALVPTGTQERSSWRSYFAIIHKRTPIVSLIGRHQQSDEARYDHRISSERRSILIHQKQTPRSPPKPGLRPPALVRSGLNFWLLMVFSKILRCQESTTRTVAMVLAEELCRTPSSSVESSNDVIPRDVGVFWDYENLPLPSGTDVPKACQAIIKAISSFGRIRDQRLYFDFGDNVPQHSKNPSWSVLDSVFDLVNTPKRNRSKETLDKKLISDVWAYAWDMSFRSNSAGCSIVLISSDGDYAHTLNKLRNRGVHCIVVHGAIESVSSVLKASADVVLSLQDDILGPHAVPRTDRPAIIVEPKKAIEPAATFAQQHDMNNEPLVPTWKSEATHKNERPAINPNHSIKDPNEVQGKRRIYRAIALCKTLQTLSDNRDGDGATSCWVTGPRVTALFAAETGLVLVDSKERLQSFRSARDLAEQLGWISHGYRLIGLDDETSSVKVIETSCTINSNPLYQKAKLGEDYLRLTERGRLVATTDFSPAALKTTCCFIKNIPVKSSLQDLVQHLESHIGVRVVLAQVRPTVSPSFWFARIKVFDDAEANQLLQAPLITLHNRRLEVSRDEFSSSILDSVSIVDCGDPLFQQEVVPASKLNDSIDCSHPNDVPQTPAVVLNTVPNPDDSTLIYEICHEHRSISDKWISGVELGQWFKESLRANQSTKQRFRTAYREAWDRGMIELGRQRTEKCTGTKIIDTVSPDDRLTGYDFGLFFRVSSSWHGSEPEGQSNNDVLARVNHSTEVMEHDHGSTSSIDVPAFAATTTTTSMERDSTDEPAISAVVRDRIDEPTIAASTPSVVEIDRDNWNDRERIEMAFEPGHVVEESDVKAKPQVSDRPHERIRGYSASSIIYYTSSQGTNYPSAKEPPSTSSRPSLTSFFRSWLS
jgi:NYN domain